MTITVTVEGTIEVALVKANATTSVEMAKLPQVSRDHIFAYGLRQILNDAMAGAKTADEASAAWQKRLDNLLAGTLRASPTRSGDPVAKRARELAEAAVASHPDFTAWAAKHNLKKADKAFRAKVAEQATKALAKPDNRFTVQARKDVEAAKDLEIEGLDL